MGHKICSQTCLKESFKGLCELNFEDKYLLSTDQVKLEPLGYLGSQILPFKGRWVLNTDDS